MNVTKQIILQYNPASYRDVIDYNPVCWDKTIHIRLTEFGENFTNSTIAGFIDKLTFLITLIAKDYLEMLKRNNPFNQVLLGKTENNKLAEYVFREVELKLYQDFDLNNTILPLIRKTFPADNIKIFPSVNKSVKNSPEKIIGSIPDSCPTSLKEFLKMFDIYSLEQFLLDDGYELKIVSVKQNRNFYEKFYNKVVKKKNKELAENKIKQIDLW